MRNIQATENSMPTTFPPPPPTIAPVVEATPAPVIAATPPPTTASTTITTTAPVIQPESSSPSTTNESPTVAPSANPTTTGAVTGCDENNNFLINGDFEFGNATGWQNPEQVVVESPDITWENFNQFSPGAYILYGGEGSANKVMSQSVDLSPFASAIDRQEMQFEISAWLVSLQPAGVSFRYDEAFLSVAFFDQAGTELLRTSELTDPTLPGDLPPDASIWDLVSEQGIIPVSARSATVFLRFFRPIGFETGAFADNVVFCVTEEM